MAGHHHPDRFRDAEIQQLAKQQAQAEAERRYYEMAGCAGVTSPRQHQVHEDLDDLGRAQQACSELLDQLTARLSPILRPEYGEGSCDNEKNPEPERCHIAGRVRSSYLCVCEVNGRIQALIERLQV